MVEPKIYIPLYTRKHTSGLITAKSVSDICQQFEKQQGHLKFFTMQGPPDFRNKLQTQTTT